MISSKGRRARAFTLVELLVVIGIVAILIGILLPVMGRVRSQARTVSCQANIRSILQSLFIYAADNKGSLPYGFIYNQMRLEPGPGRNGTSTGTPAYSFNCFSMMTKIMNPKTNSGGMLSVYGFNKVFKCPEGTMAPEFVQPIHYAQHGVAMPDITKEIAGYPLGGTKENIQKDVIKPARLTDLYPDNALIWDTPLNLSFQNWLPDDADKQTGPTWGYIDGGQLIFPDQPEYRYRNNEDPFPTDPFLSWGYPVNFSNDYTAATVNGGFGPNTDNTHATSTAGSIVYDNFHTGNLRFRHNNGNVCNVGFADGVVRPLAWFPKRYVKDTSPNDFAADNEMLRKYIMIKWPKNKKPSWAE